MKGDARRYTPIIMAVGYVLAGSDRGGSTSRFVEVFNDSRIMTDLNHTSYKVLLEILKHLVLII